MAVTWETCGHCGQKRYCERNEITDTWECERCAAEAPDDAVYMAADAAEMAEARAALAGKECENCGHTRGTDGVCAYCEVPLPRPCEACAKPVLVTWLGRCERCRDYHTIKARYTRLFALLLERAPSDPCRYARLANDITVRYTEALAALDWK